MQPQTFIFIGRSGSGKGTQAKLLIEALKKADPSRDVLYIQTGEEFRKFIKGDSYTERLAKTSYESGDLMPEFLSIHQWVKALVERFTGSEHIIFDGTPRKIHEAGVLDSVFGYYKLGKPWVIDIDISAEEAVRRLLERKRLDDTEEDIRERLSWFETDVAPTIQYFSANPGYTFFRVGGERSMEEIHADIVKMVGLK